MKLSNDVEKYEIEATKMGQNYSFFSYSVLLVTLAMLPVEYES